MIELQTLMVGIPILEHKFSATGGTIGINLELTIITYLDRLLMKPHEVSTPDEKFCTTFSITVPNYIKHISLDIDDRNVHRAK